MDNNEDNSHRKTIDKKQLTPLNLLNEDMRLIPPINANRASVQRYGSNIQESEAHPMGKVQYESSHCGDDQKKCKISDGDISNLQDQPVNQQITQDQQNQDETEEINIVEEMHDLRQMQEEQKQINQTIIDQLSHSSSSIESVEDRAQTNSVMINDINQIAQDSEKIKKLRLPNIEVNESSKEYEDADNEEFQDEITDSEMIRLKKAVIAADLSQVPAQPLVKTGISIAADMKMGWRPRNQYSGAPIPLYYEFEEFKVSLDGLSPSAREPIYLGPRIPFSTNVHRLFARKIIDEETSTAYQFKFPPKPAQSQRKRIEEPREFTGMNPDHQEKHEQNDEIDKYLKFDSIFENGNLDMVFRNKEDEYFMYMRVDTNTRGHHQWFHFSVEYQQYFQGKTITFHIMNFTKEDSLFGSGMRICIKKSSEGDKYVRGGMNISYKKSRHLRKKRSDPSKQRFFYQLSFSYKFDAPTDKVFFAYCYPYTYSMLQQFIKEISLMRNAIRNSHSGKIGSKIDFFQETVLCKSLSGADVPLITITSRLTTDPTEYNLIKMEEFEDHDSKVSMPMNQRKKYVVITGRVHPGESNSSWMMQGFIRCLMSSSLQAKQLRKRIIFLIVPMINVDGVIIGNYRTSMAGNDLNRRYLDPDPRLHPEVCAVKDLIHQLIYGKDPALIKETKADMKKPLEPVVIDEDIMAFMDMHGHSRKKNAFVYGPQFPLSSDKYYRSRLIPKLLSEETSKFRYHSCQFKYEYCKRKTARIVLAREYNIMNCYTLEASFSGHFDENRNNYEFTLQQYEEMGEHLVNTLYEYVLILEEEQRIRQLREIDKKKRKKAALSSQKQKESQQAAISIKATNDEHKFDPSALKEKPQIEKNNSLKKKKLLMSLKNNSKGKADAQMDSGAGSKSGSSNQVDEVDEQQDEDQIDTQRSNRHQKSKKKSDNIDKNNDDSVERDIPVQAGGIRRMKDLFGALQKEEEKRDEMLKIEEQELGFVPDRDEPKQNEFEPDFDNSDSGNDSDASDGELGGKDKRDLFSDILGAIKAFSQQYDGNTSYNQQHGRYIQKRKKEGKKSKKKDKQDAVVSSITAVSRFKDIKQSEGQKSTKLVDKPQVRKSVPPVKLDRVNLTKAGMLKKQKDSNLEQLTPKNIQIPDVTGNTGAIVSSPYQPRQQETRDQREDRVALRQKIAQQGLLNRIGLKMQATKTVPQKPFLAVRYTNTVQQPIEGAGGVLSPLVVNKIYTNDNANGQGPINKNMKVNPHERRVNQNLRNGYTNAHNQSQRKRQVPSPHIPHLEKNLINSDNFLSHAKDVITIDPQQSQVMQTYFWQKYGIAQQDQIDQNGQDQNSDITPAFGRNRMTDSSNLGISSISEKVSPMRVQNHSRASAMVLDPSKNSMQQKQIEALSDQNNYQIEGQVRKNDSFMYQQFPSASITQNSSIERRGDNSNITQKAPSQYHQALLFQSSYQDEYPSLSSMISKEESNMFNRTKTESNSRLSESPAFHKRTVNQIRNQDYQEAQNQKIKQKKKNAQGIFEYGKQPIKPMHIQEEESGLISGGPNSLFSRYRQQEQLELLRAQVGGGNIFLEPTEPSYNSMQQSMNIMSLAANPTKKPDQSHDYQQSYLITPQPKTSKSNLEWRTNGREPASGQKVKKHLRQYGKPNPSVDFDHVAQRTLNELDKNQSVMGMVQQKILSKSNNRQNIRQLMDNSIDQTQAGNNMKEFLNQYSPIPHIQVHENQNEDKIKIFSDNLATGPPGAPYVLNPLKIKNQKRNQGYSNQKSDTQPDVEDIHERLNMIQPKLQPANPHAYANTVMQGPNRVLDQSLQHTPSNQIGSMSPSFSNLTRSQQKLFLSKPGQKPPIQIQQQQTVQHRNNKLTGGEQIKNQTKYKSKMLPSLPSTNNVQKTSIPPIVNNILNQELALRQSQAPQNSSQSNGLNNFSQSPQTINVTTLGPFSPGLSHQSKMTIQQLGLEVKCKDKQK